MAAPMQRAWLGLLRPAVPAARSYEARPRPPWGGVYRPAPDDPFAPKWQLQPAYEAKLYGRHGSASGVDPAQLWPSPAKLQEMEAEEREWYPGLREMEAALDKKEQEEERRRVEREKLIAANMAKMPQMIEDWRQEKVAREEKEREDKARRERLLAKAQELFGHKVDHRSTKFQELVQEMEKKERKELKLKKKQLKEEAKKAAAAAPEAVSVSAGGAEPV
ncbi:large ribosomal subunit protein mL64 [Emydura macquarii macquarii]|uniref:large ribosomal subunit protein mL64 n=1 Tax=Emydura macquarii macquarii TaxID=1129001 RepID=UPI00352B206F